MAKTGVIYTGQVDIKVKNKKYRLYNQGHDKLFELFARFLCSIDKVSNEDLPCFLDIRKKDGSSILYQHINIVKETKQRDSQWCTIITGNITDSNLANAPGEFDSDHSLILTNKNNEILATVTLSKEILNQITIRRQALIEWSLYISNKEGEK